MAQTPSDSLSQDDVFDILSNARRRYVLYYLRDTGEPVQLGTLAQELAAWENDTTVEDLTKQQRKRVYVSLYQTHIQKLQEAGLVEYDQETGLVSLADDSRVVNQYLPDASDDEQEVPWQHYYIALAVGSAVLYALVTFEVAFFGVISELLAGLAITLALMGLAIAHFLYTRQSSAELPAEALIRK